VFAVNAWGLGHASQISDSLPTSGDDCLIVLLYVPHAGSWIVEVGYWFVSGDDLTGALHDL